MEPKRLEVKRPRPTKRSDPHNDFTPESLEAKRRSEITRKALHTAKWARTMTKWLITHSGKGGVKWRLVEFGGKNGHESKGVVDMIAIRKDYKTIADGGHIGDLLDIVLIQVKGGNSPLPKTPDIERLNAVKEHHRASKVVLAVTTVRLKPEQDQLVGGVDSVGCVLVGLEGA